MKKLTFLLAFLILFSACSQEHKEATNKDADKTQTKETVHPQSGIVITNAWVRPAAKDRNTGIFLNILNNSDSPDTLTGAKSGAAQKTEVHETFKQGDDMLGMREVENIVIQPHETFELKPMHNHIMLIKLNQDVKSGDTVKVVLQFSRYGDLTVTATAKEHLPEGSMHDMHK